MKSKRFFKNKLRAFISLARLNRPSGIALLALPCFFGVFLAFANSPEISYGQLGKMLILFACGAILMRSAGCVMNDILDRKFDRQVARTKKRPLASGELRLIEALIFLAVLLFLSLLILLQFNLLVQLSGLGALALAGLYPLMKRITYFPQIFLGLAFNYGIIMADLAINQTLSQASLLLFAACVIWTLIYDTIYAFQDIEDDMKIGVKSSAQKVAHAPKAILSCLALAMFALIFYIGFLQEFSIMFFIFNLAAFFYLLFLVRSCKFASAKSCLRKFKANIWVGGLILAGIIFS